MELLREVRPLPPVDAASELASPPTVASPPERRLPAGVGDAGKSGPCTELCAELGLVLLVVSC
jgi:hypothetical protein